MEIQPIEILKWVGIVLAAGFVGYFGRYLAMVIIEKLRKQSHRTGAVGGSSTKESRQQTNVNQEIPHKIEKKKEKAAAKRAKKAGKL